MNTDWHSAAVIHDFQGSEVYFLVQDSRSLKREWASQGIQTKFVGGGRDTLKDHDELGTLRREIFQEIRMHLSMNYDVPEIRTYVKSGGAHIQHFYLVPFSYLTGRMRPRDKVVRDGDSLLSNLRWITARHAGIMFGKHKDVMLVADAMLRIQLERRAG